MALILYKNEMHKEAQMQIFHRSVDTVQKQIIYSSK